MEKKIIRETEQMREYSIALFETLTYEQRESILELMRQIVNGGKATT